MKRRINLFGGPCSGKSTTAAEIFTYLKRRNWSVEMVREHVKMWAYQKRIVQSFDQVYLQARQMQEEDTLLRCGVQTIVTDAPVLLSAFYAQLYKIPGCEELTSLSHKFDVFYPPMNIVLDRGDKPYVSQGRYQTEEQALQADVDIRDFLSRNLQEFSVFDFQDVVGILRHVTQSLGITTRET